MVMIKIYERLKQRISGRRRNRYNDPERRDRISRSVMKAGRAQRKRNYGAQREEK